MMKLLKTAKNIWIAFFISLLASFMIASVSYAQSASPSAQPPDKTSKYGVTFPVAALGNCTDLNSCKTFCDDLINRDTCIAFAKSKGFYKEDALTTQKETVLAKAKAALGCNSETSCLNFCTIPANQDKCSSFAQSTNLQGGVVASPDNQAIINRAKDVLGCSSETTCKSFCEQDANRGKCADFARQVGLRGGEQKIGPGGCTSEQTCKAFCSNPDNFQICSGFTQSAGGNFSGPGGCNSPESCKSYCQQNPQSCSGFGGPGQNPQSGLNPAEMCNRTPNCSWTGVTCYCGNGNSGTNASTQSGADNPAATCFKYGCTYTGNSCQCQNIGSNYDLGAAKQGCEAAKGTWTGNYCNMSSGSSPYSGGASYQQQEAVCKAGGGTCAAGSTTNFCNCQGYQIPQYSANPQSSSSPQNYIPQHSCASTVCSSGYAPDPGNNCACILTPGGNGNYNTPTQGYSTPNGPATYAQQEATCKAGGGTCASGSTSNFCNCQGYQGPPPGSSCQPPSSGCGSNSYYDYGRCGCYQNGSTPTAPPTSGSCPAGQYWNGSGCVNSNTAPQNSPAPTSTSQPSPAQTSSPQSSSAVKGISTEVNIWTWLINLISK